MKGIEYKLGVVEDRTNDLIETAREAHECDLDCDACQLDLKALSVLDCYADYVSSIIEKVADYFKR